MDAYKYWRTETTSTVLMISQFSDILPLAVCQKKKKKSFEGHTQRLTEACTHNDLHFFVSSLLNLNLSLIPT